MTRVVAMLSAVTMLGCASGAQQAPAWQPLESRPRLSKLDVILENSVPFVIYYNPAFTTIIKQNVESADHPGTATRAIQTKIDGSATDTYIVDVDPGPSFDPHFVVYRKDIETLLHIASIKGSEFVAPGDGFVYVSGAEDDYFNIHRKYVLNGGKLEEVMQPFYFVGITTTNRSPLNLYTDTTYQNTVVRLPSDTIIEVLLAQRRVTKVTKEETPGGAENQFHVVWQYDFLVKSPHGLIGWVAGDGICGAEPMRGICFHGD